MPHAGTPLRLKAVKAAVILYTGHTDFTADDSPTFTVVGERDGIANPAVM